LIHRWHTRPVLLIIAWIGTVVSLAWCILVAGDPAGRLLIGVTAAVLGVAAAYATRARPRLVAGSDGITIGGLRGPAVFGWPQVRDIRVVRTHRFGRAVCTLEIETFGPGAQDIGERLHVFGRLDLGADPEDVGDTLLALRPPRPPGR
jgi:hypothetical protein